MGLGANGARMRSLCFLLMFGLFTPAFAEQVVERQGWKVLTFDIPGMTLAGKKDNRTTRATFSKPVGDSGEVKVTVYVKSWLAIDTFESKFRNEKERARASGESRLRDAVVVPGADKVLTYTSTAPFEGEVVVLYTKDFIH